MSCVCPTCGGALADDGLIRIDVETGIIVAQGHAAQLTRREFALFEALWTAKPRPRSKEQLLAATARAGFNDDRDIKLVDVFICKIRKKLVPLGIEIATLWGEGYRIVGGKAHV